jgi:hypothetical protein
MKLYNMSRSVDTQVLKKVICAASVVLIAGIGISCSTFRQQRGGSPELRESLKEAWLTQAPLAGPSIQARRLWIRRLTGYISDINISSRGNAVLVGTLPDYDDEDGSRKNLLHYFDGHGRERWSKVLPTAVKSQAISAHASLAVVATHEDEVLAFSESGKKLWSAHATCSPIIINSRKEVICYHDDDAEPEIAFDVFNWNGKKIRSYPIKNDILTLKVSEDEYSTALALTQGMVQVLGPDYKLKWNARVEGEIVDIDISIGRDPRLAVLYSAGIGKP